MNRSFYLSSMGMTCALGHRQPQILERLIAGDRAGMVIDKAIIPHKTLRLGKVTSPLPICPTDNPGENSRNNRLLLAALEPIRHEVNRLKDKYGLTRIGVVLGTSTSGTLEAEHSMDDYLQTGYFTQGYTFRTQEMGDPSRFLARHCGVKGPAYTVSTACSSSGKVFLSARNLIRAGLCDAVIVGGADSLCQLTVHGFSALESVSSGYCQPFCVDRDGINLGEGAALFTLTAEPASIRLQGMGESSDAWHISAPHPEGRGAATAMQQALQDAQLPSHAIDYLNLHGTATPLNDAMESLAIKQVFAHAVACSATKTMTGHTLGAAGAIEAAIAWLLLSDFNPNHQLPPHVTDTPLDETARLNFVQTQYEHAGRLTHIMSNSFAFGGSNVSVILSRE